jgi:type IV fimbrial biogenesis protein FimT
MKNDHFIVPRSATGFTLIELLVTLAIAGILLAVAAPSFQSSLSSNGVRNATTRLSDSLAYARSQAVTRSSNVIICSKAAIGNTCSAAVVPSWVNGWLIYIDGAGVVDVDNDGTLDDLLLRVEDIASLNLSNTGIATASSITYSSAGSANVAITISFVGSDGVVANGADALVNLQGLFSHTSGATALKTD